MTARRFIPSVDQFYETIEEMLAGPIRMSWCFDYQKCFFGEDSMFWDSDHVNVAGAEYLTLNVWKDYLERSLARLPDGEAREKQEKAISALRLKIAGLERQRRFVREAKKVREMVRSGKADDAVRLAETAFGNGNHEKDILMVLLAGVADSKDGALRRQLTEAVKTSPSPEKLEFSGGRVVALGLTGDFWTTDGNPAYLTVAAPEDRPDRHEFWLSCGADGDVLPLTATIDDGSRQVRHVFREPARVRISLPEVPSGASRLFVVKADKTWVPPSGKDTRRLGVRIVPVEADGDPL